MDRQGRIQIILETIDRWLAGGSSLEAAVEKTVHAGCFPRHDIDFSLETFRQSIDEQGLTRWCEKAGLAASSGTIDKRALCFHAGNIPLVGIQDVIAVLLSGYSYAGKISRKDPYLISSLLEEFGNTDLSGHIRYSTEMNELRDLNADAVLFSGSGSSVRQVRNKTGELNLARPDARFLIRTADFSMAYVDRDDPQTLTSLTEAMLRYEGKGCRSVAIIVSPLDPDKLIDRLEEHMDTFWHMYPAVKTLHPKTHYRYAYNKAIGRKQYLINHLLIQVNGLELDNDDVVYWVQGDPGKAASLAEIYLRKIQNVYISGDETVISGFEDRTEPLSQAQRPAISWKPDAVDPLTWLGEGM